MLAFPRILALAVALCSSSLRLPDTLSAAESHTRPTAEQLITHLGMAKIPDEGAWFAVTYESELTLPADALPARYGGKTRLAGTSIYALITPADFSALHRLKTDEIWHYHAGDPIELLLLFPDGTHQLTLVGPDVLAGQHPQVVVKAGTWMAARPRSDQTDAYSLFGCTLAPGFDYGDYEPGYRDTLQATYPDAAQLITALTRAEFTTAPAKTPAPPAASVTENKPTARVISPDTITPYAPAPGVELRELIGRVAEARTTSGSVARFKLAAGQGTGRSYNQVGEEYFLIISGEGMVELDGKHTAVTAGTAVLIPAGCAHELTAGAGGPLEFYAITTPAFTPKDYVQAEPLTPAKTK